MASPPDFTTAKILFSLAALVLIPPLGYWVISANASTGERLTVSFFVFGVLGVIWAWTMLWLADREMMLSKQTVKNQAEQQIESAPSVEQKLEGRMPKLKGHFGRVWVDPIQESKDSSRITIPVIISNSGSPSIAQGFQLKVRVPGAQDFRDAKPVLVIGELFISELEVYNMPGDSLREKTAITPIPEGGMVTGILVEMLDGVRPELVAQPGTKMKLIWYDVKEKEYSFDWTWSDKTRPGPYIVPGLTKQKTPKTENDLSK